MNKDQIRQWSNLSAYILMVVINGLANVLPINNQTTGAVSDSFDVFFVPAAYVFSIWGLIYLALGAFIIYQLLPAQKENPAIRKIGYWFVLSSLANASWIFLWHYELFGLSVIVMLVLLISLIQIYLRLDIGRKRVSKSDAIFVHLPFSIYLGWITVATVANVTSWLDFIGWSGWGIATEMWAVIMLAVAAVISFVMTWLRADVAYLLVIIWASIGIAVRQARSLMVSETAWIVAILVAGMVIVSILRRRKILRT